MSFSMHFECDKSILLNIMYDTLDKLGGELASSDSERGNFLVCMNDGTKLQLDISPFEDGSKTTVLSAGGKDSGWQSVILEEIESRRHCLYGCAEAREKQNKQE